MIEPTDKCQLLLKNESRSTGRRKLLKLNHVREEFLDFVVFAIVSICLLIYFIDVLNSGSKGELMFKAEVAGCLIISYFASVCIYAILYVALDALIDCLPIKFRDDGSGVSPDGSELNVAIKDDDGQV